MGNTILFAPEVEAVQNADCSIDSMTIKFSYSSTGYWDIGATLVDPSEKISWSTNYNTVFDISKIDDTFFDNEKNIYYRKLINITSNNQIDYQGKFILYSAEKLVLDQYYQVQLFAIEYEDEGKTIVKGTSPLSKVTLVRRVSNFETTYVSFVRELTGVSKIQGNVVPTESSSKEYLLNCYYIISQAEKVYIAARSNEVSQFNFNISVAEPLPAGTYDLLLQFTTLHGLKYSYKILNKIIIQDLFAEDSLWDKNNNNIEIAFSDDDKIGGAFLSINCYLPAAESGDIIGLQRSDLLSNYTKWQDMALFRLSESILEKNIAFNWTDCFLLSNQTYKYRIYFKTKSQLADNYKVTYLSNKDFVYKVKSLEHIYLSDQDKMLAIQYNPNISGFKYVTQESVANTLGGKYPIIRINGDTYYRQFSLSGTLYFSLVNLNDSLDSQNHRVDDWMEDAENSGLYFSQSSSKEQLWMNSSNTAFIQTQMRECAIEFLTNKAPKLFRSAEEGTMIVFLSGVSFTPNKQLSRTAWDFSATVTEVAEPIEENLKKYGFNNISNKGIYIYDLLVATEGVQDYCAYINAEEVLINNMLQLSAKKVGELYE